MNDAIALNTVMDLVEADLQQAWDHLQNGVESRDLSHLSLAQMQLRGALAKIASVELLLTPVGDDVRRLKSLPNAETQSPDAQPQPIITTLSQGNR